MKTNIYLCLYLAPFFLEREMFQTELVQEINTHFITNNFLLKWLRLWDSVEKYCTAGEDNVAHDHCMLIPKATNTFLEYVILIALPLQY